IHRVGCELAELFLSEDHPPLRRAGIRVSNLTDHVGQKTLLEF
ncbi:MAG: DNA polymerase IV, partial [Methanobacteriota archaeon]